MRLRGGGAASIDVDGRGKSEDKGETKLRLPRVWYRYLECLERRPLLTKAASTGFIDGTANLIEQTLSPTPFVSVLLDSRQPQTWCCQ